MALDDGTWDTTIVHVPEDALGDGDLETELRSYAENELATQAQWRRTVLWAVYSYTEKTD